MIDASSYYNGYLLDVDEFELSESDKQLLNSCIFLVDNRSSIRMTAKNMGFSKSTLHRHIHSNLRLLSYELYRVVIHQLQCNRRWK